MKLFRSHPYASGSIGAIVLILIGAAFVRSRVVNPASAGVVAWSGDGALTDAGAQPAPRPAEEGNPTASSDTPREEPGTATLPYTMTPAASSSSQAPAQDGFDLNALLSLLSSGSGGKKPQTSPASAPVNPWSFIPSGMISTTSAQKSRTALQQSLYEYGNRVGSYIKSYDQAHANQASILASSAQDRSNGAKAAAVASIGRDLENVGIQIAAASPPEAAAASNAALSSGYQSIGAKLIAVSAATGGADADFLASIKAYDAAADSFTRTFVASAALFSANGVQFTSADAGSVFSFNARGL